MLKRHFLLLSLCVSCALLLVACASSNSDNAASKLAINSGGAVSSGPTPSVAKASTTPVATASAGDKIGVPECDDYLAKYETCVSSKVPAAARAQYESTLAQTRKSWRDLAANPQTRASLAAACKTATESARTSLKSLGCEF